MNTHPTVENMESTTGVNPERTNVLTKYLLTRREQLLTPLFWNKFIRALKTISQPNQLLDTLKIFKQLGLFGDQNQERLTDIFRELANSNLNSSISETLSDELDDLFTYVSGYTKEQISKASESDSNPHNNTLSNLYGFILNTLFYRFNPAIQLLPEDLKELVRELFYGIARVTAGDQLATFNRIKSLVFHP